MAKKTIYFDKLCGFSVTAVTEGGKLTDCRFTAEDGTPAVGNIYKGVVVNVLSGMQAAFVDCGLSRNCYLSAEDLPYNMTGGLSALKAGDTYENLAAAAFLPQFLRAVRQALHALVRRRKLVVVTRRWRIVAWLLRHLPDRLYLGM